MTDFKIRDLPDEETSPADDDFLAIDDVSGTKLKKIKLSNLVGGHASTHEDGGVDEIGVTGLSGLLADDQNPTPHASDHTDGADDIQDATAAQKGVATADHITKLDGIETNAKNDQTGVEIVALLEALVGLAKLSHDSGLSDISSNDHHAKLHAADHVNETDDIQNATASQKGLATSIHITKLNGIEALAEVNNISDVNATDLTDAGESTLHYHASDRNLANATGTINDTKHGNRGGGALHAVVIAAGAAGFMSGADKTKLNGIEALADVTGSHAPQAHNTSHQSGGGDAIKLDDLAAPDDNTDLNASITKHGLLIKLAGGDTTFLRADGVWAIPGGAPSIPSGTKMYFYEDVAPTGWTIESVTDRVLAVKGGSQAYNVSGGTGAGTWTQPNHAHSGPSHRHTGPNHRHTGPSHRHKWFDNRATNQSDLTYNSLGNAIQLPDGSGAKINPSYRTLNYLGCGEPPIYHYDLGDCYTSNAGTGNTGYQGTGYTSYGGTGSTGGGATANTYRPLAAVGIIASKD